MGSHSLLCGTTLFCKASFAIPIYLPHNGSKIPIFEREIAYV